MKTLFVNACVREESRTLEIARYLLEKLGEGYEEVDLGKEKIEALDRERLQKRSDLAMKGDFSDEIFRYARQFREAECIVIAAPYWDLSFPAKLKEYLENICVVGLTFDYVCDDVTRSLSKAKRLIYVMTAGGTVVSHELSFGYVRTMMHEFFHIDDFKYIYAEKLDLYGADPGELVAKAKKEVDEYTDSLKL